MRLIPAFLGALLVCSLLGASPTQHPIPPGLREADKLPEPNNVPPPPPVRRGADPAQLRREADELAKLASAVPVEIDQVTKGELPKDLNENLKKIEKLAKRLRSEVSP
jgi:hypothetical protein